MTSAAERKAAEKAAEERLAAEEAAEQPQPTVPEPLEDSKFTEEPVEAVGDYPERPYSEAISEKHLAFLAANHPERLPEIGIQE
jgi:hypothetical protein